MREVSSSSDGVNTSSSCIQNGDFLSFYTALTPYSVLSINRRFIYGGIGLGVGAVAIISILALSNVRLWPDLPQSYTERGINIHCFKFTQRSYIWTRVCAFLWPFVIVVCAVRAILMIVELQRGYVFFFPKPLIFALRAHLRALWFRSVPS